MTPLDINVQRPQLPRPLSLEASTWLCAFDLNRASSPFPFFMSDDRSHCSRLRNPIDAKDVERSNQRGEPSSPRPLTLLDLCSGLCVFASARRFSPQSESKNCALCAPFTSNPKSLEPDPIEKSIAYANICDGKARGP